MHIFKNKLGKSIALMNILLFLSLIVYFYYQSNFFAYQLLIVPIFFTIFFFKEIRINKDKMVLYYPLRPLFRLKSIENNKIKKVIFKVHGDNLTSYSFVSIYMSSFPFITEVRTQRPGEIFSFFETIAESSFKVKSKGKQNHFIIDHLRKKGIDYNLNFVGE